SWKPLSGGDTAGYHVERAPVEVFSEDEVLRLKKDTRPLDAPSVGSVRAIGAFERLTKEAGCDASFTDTSVDLAKLGKIQGDPIYTRTFAKEQLDANGKPYRLGVYAYRIRAINALGVEGGPSPYFLTIPSAPQSVFAREEGEQCHLKWVANPEKG